LEQFFTKYSEGNMNEAKRLANWIAAGLAIGLLAVVFLSSGRPALGAHHPYMAMGNAIDITMELTQDPDPFGRWHDPVPYLSWDTSRMLNGWYSLMLYQLALGVFQAHEEAEKKAKDDLVMEQWRREKASMNRLIAAIGFVLTILLFPLVWWLQRRKGKRI
jgi:hypothetical protein